MICFEKTVAKVLDIKNKLKYFGNRTNKEVVKNYNTGSVNTHMCLDPSSLKHKFQIFFLAKATIRQLD